jgi:hypothetical protein
MVAHPLTAGNGPADPTGAGRQPAVPSLQVCDVRVELGDLLTDADVRADLASDPAHWLLEFAPEIATTPAGRAKVEMTVPGPDLWTATLTTMAVLRRAGYDLHAIHVQSRTVDEDQPAA